MKYGNILVLAGVVPLLTAASEIAAPVSEVQIFRNGESVIRHTADPKGKKHCRESILYNGNSRQRLESRCNAYADCE